MNKWQQFITGTLTMALLGAGSVALADTSSTAEERSGKAVSERHKHEGHPHAERGAEPGEYHQRRHGMAQLAEKLNLTEEQKQALRDERARLMGDNRVDHGELREAHKALRQARKDNASEPEIAALSDRLQQLRAEHQAQREQMHESFLSILTPEQRERLAELKAERKAERKEQYRKGEHKHKKGHGKGRPDGGDAN